MKSAREKYGIQICCLFCILFLSRTQGVLAAQAVDYYLTPSFLTTQVPPLVMLVMGKNHKLFYEAYNDASDLNEDGVLDVGYKGEDEPYTDANSNGQWDIGESYTDTNGDGKWTAGINYYGYFDSHKCYDYSGGVFIPQSAPLAGTKPIKKCTGANDTYWSGDFLNYITMSRMDALRKVLYGGMRSTDTATSTILQRAYIPQDAHSWGKEYESIATNGFDIREYTPLQLPVAGYRHLFANTTLSNNGTPLLRVLNDSKYRAIEWVSIERPVAGTKCLHGSSGPDCATAGGTQWEIVPATAFTSLTRSTYNISSYALSHADDHAEFDAIEATYANAIYLFGSGSAVNINGTGNPFGVDDNYMTIFEGKINIPTAGTYEFAVDGDDAIEVMIDGIVVAGYYGGHGSCGCTTHSGSIALTAGDHDIKYRHEERTGGDSYYLKWSRTVPSSTMTDYTVRVEVCNAALPETNCNVYSNGKSKPVGLLQKYGEDEKMYFGLLSGSYAKNMSGGVLRKNVSSINDEIDSTTGAIIAPAGGGIIDTLNKIRIAQFDYAANYSYPGGWVTTRPMNDGEFRDWGNPIGEMMYETIRYFAGKSSPTPAFDYVNAGSLDNTLGLPKPPWQKPYDTYERCASPYMLVLSDIFPTFDSDQLHGVNANFGAGLAADDFSTGANNTYIMDVSALARAISTGEGINDNYYIGQQNALYDGSCTPKVVDDLSEIRGMCPEEPTKRGSYYAAAVAYYGAKYDINPDVDGAQRVSTFAVGLASPLPKINIDVPDGMGGTTRVTLIPFAKSTGGSGISAAQGSFQPTNTITDFYVKEITPTYGKFEVNFEDVEQGADHDMDAVSVYEYNVVGGTIEITMTSTYAAGGIEQHMGYIISGTTADGIYLEVRDEDTNPADDNDYFLDTPPGELPGGNWNDGVSLPLSNTRIFTPGATPGASLLENPLYYAAKWGGFQERDTPDEDTNNNGLLDAGEDLNGNGKIDYIGEPQPNLEAEWDRDANGVPDSYFYVVNPLRLEEQLSRSFAEMLRRASSGTAASVISSSRSGEGAVYQSVFYPEYEDGGGLTVQWAGLVRSLMVDGYGNMRVDMYRDPSGNIVKDTFRGVKQINTRNEDLNYNGFLDISINEDVNGNNLLDPGEDLNFNGRLDYTLNEQYYDYDEDGQLDYRDLIVVFSGNQASLWDDINENGLRDVEDETTFSPDIPGWHNNGILNTEDTNGNGVLDSGEDINGNGNLDTEDLNGNGSLDTELIATGYSPNEIQYLWSSSDWLDSFGFDPLLQRTYTSNSQHRYIFSFVDSDNDMIADAGEVKDFLTPAVPNAADLVDTSKIFPYLTLYPSFDDKPAWVSNIEFEGNRTTFLQQQAKRVVDFIRGQDQAFITIGTYSVPAMRSRLYQDALGVPRTWRLGDIVSSSPTLVAKPPANYHNVYRDKSYAYFAAQYSQRRSVVYVGGNDGMIHAFNAGFYNIDTQSFQTSLAEKYIDANQNNVYDAGEKFADYNNDGVWTAALQTPYDLGSELWAYVPFNLLPHLYWLTEDTYPHVYYNDLAPKIFDAKIFQDDADHPKGWGTVMVVGMKFGGGNIIADIDRDDIVDPTDKIMSSAYVVFDITNPEIAPKLLAEITLPQMGYATCYPTVVPMRSKNGSGNHTVFDSNDWYLVFGSGPADVNGIAASRDTTGSVTTSGTIGEPAVLAESMSLQDGKLFVVDLKALADNLNPEVRIIDENGASIPVIPSTTSAFIEEFNEPSFISDPITIDYNLDFNADVVYFGDVIWDSANSEWGGKLRRLIINNDTSTAHWINLINVAGTDVDRADNVLIDLTLGGVNSINQPITARPTAAVTGTVGFDIDGDGGTDDFDRERWIFFGTGRFLVGSDSLDTTQQSYYGIKEPYDGSPNYGFTWEEVPRTGLLDSTLIDIYNDKTVDNFSGGALWSDLIDSVEPNGAYQGWHIDFLEAKERNLGQAALLGGLLTFTTYKPSTDICLAEGNSNLYALWYQTGTPFYKQVFRNGNTWNDIDGDGVVDKGELKLTGKVDLGAGLAITPNIHVGLKQGSTVYVQSSTGDIVTIEQAVDIETKSHKTSWEQRQ